MPSASELGAYILPGRVLDPKPGIEQAKAAEAFGLGSVWCADRWDTKEAGAICGALSQATSRIKFAAGMTHFVTRHPIALAGMAMTLQALSEGRFVLGVARKIKQIWDPLGISTPTNAMMRDYAQILRALWAGETVNYDGPAGRYPAMRMAEPPHIMPPPLMLAAIGPKTLALAGAHFDAVALHPFLSPEGLRKSAEVVKRAAEQAGRNPDDVKICAAVVVAPDLSEEETDAVVRGRAVTYFSVRSIGELMIRFNGWDMSPMERLTTDERFANLELKGKSHEEYQAIKAEATALIPELWLSEGAAVGSPASVAKKLLEYREAGADEIILHGTTPDRVGGIVKAYEAL
jgi:5,10-methylenetetrahydromethanopterin reductase